SDRPRTSPLADGARVELGRSFFVCREALPRAEPALLEQRALKPLARGMATLSPAFALELERVATFARSQVPVLVSGQTGTGKELIASAIHQLSGRPGPFVAVNCGAIAPNLVESELFGYRKGAFSGALEDRPGLVRSSEHGRRRLDGFGALPLAAQAALLRVLQESEVLPVGGTRPVKVDLRVVAATHRDLGALAAQDRFRRDLLARLDGARIMLPALRERREDFGLILSALMAKTIELVRATGGNVTAAGRTMGKPRTQVQRWLRRFEIDPASFIR